MVTQQRIQEWISHPAMLDKESLFELRELLARYPYFQTARLLYLKNLFLLQDASFADELRKSALYVADLSVLFYYIEGERFVLKRHEAPAEASADKCTADRTLDLIDRFLSDLSGDDAEPEPSLKIPVEVSVDYMSVLSSEPTPEEQEVAPLKGQELIDSFIEQSGSESVEPKPKEEVPVEETPAEETPAEEVVKDDETSTEQPEKAVEADEDESYFTETLAKIYVRQHRYEKALEIIKKLNLKYPKKNIYFADQIRFLEKLIINEKSK
jgi:tetratricopeptide (TPR) repeat protein